MDYSCHQVNISSNSIALILQSGNGSTFQPDSILEMTKWIQSSTIDALILKVSNSDDIEKQVKVNLFESSNFMG